VKTFTLLLCFFSAGLLSATEPSRTSLAPTFGLPAVQDCVAGSCSMPARFGVRRTVNYSAVPRQVVSYQPTTVMQTQMVEQTVQVPVEKTITVMETQTTMVPVQVAVDACQACVSTVMENVPTSVTRTRTRRVGFLGRWRARFQQRRTARRSARSNMNGC